MHWKGSNHLQGSLYHLWSVCLRCRATVYGCHLWKLFLFLEVIQLLSLSLGSRLLSSLCLSWVGRDSNSATSPFPCGLRAWGHSGPEAYFKMKSRAKSPSFWTEPRFQSPFFCPDWYPGQQLILIHFLLASVPNVDWKRDPQNQVIPDFLGIPFHVNEPCTGMLYYAAVIECAFLLTRERWWTIMAPLNSTLSIWWTGRELQERCVWFQLLSAGDTSKTVCG